MKGRKPSFDKMLAIKLFKAGMSFVNIAQKVNSTENAVRMFIKRNAAELKKNPVDKYKVIQMFKDGMKYKEIAENLNSTEHAIKMIIKRNAPELMRERKASMDNSSLFEPTEEELNLINLGYLTIEDRKQLMNERTYGINNSEGMSTKAFLNCIWQSYKTDQRTGRVKFDSSRGAITRDVPPSYMPGAEFKNGYNCLIINSNGEKESINIKAYDNFYARKEARRKVNGNVAILKCEKLL